MEMNHYQFATQPGPINMDPTVWRYPYSLNSWNCSYWLWEECTQVEQCNYLLATVEKTEEELYADENTFRMFCLFVHWATTTDTDTNNG